MNKGYIYKYTFPNGKIYIGQTKTSVEQRHKQHLWYAKNGGKIKNRQLCDIAIAKYGEPKLEVIEEIIDDDNKPYQFKKALDNAEIKWIKEYNSTNRNVGYNIQHGGHIANEEQYILEEIYHEKIQERSEKIFYIKEILDSIIEKFENDDLVVAATINLKRVRLTKEEKYIWYNYKFHDYAKDETTFNDFLKHAPWCDDFASMVNMMFEMFLVDISNTVWQEIETNKEKLIQEFLK